MFCLLVRMCSPRSAPLPTKGVVCRTLFVICLLLHTKEGEREKANQCEENQSRREVKKSEANNASGLEPLWRRRDRRAIAANALDKDEHGNKNEGERINSVRFTLRVNVAW